MRRRGSWTFRSMLVGIVIFSGVMTFQSMFVTDLIAGTPKSPAADPSTGFDRFNQTDRVAQNAESIKETILSIDITDPLTWGNVVTLVVQAGGTLMETPFIINDIMVDIAELLHLPGEIVVIVWALALVIAVTELFSILNKYDV